MFIESADEVFIILYLPEQTSTLELLSPFLDVGSWAGKLEQGNREPQRELERQRWSLLRWWPGTHQFSSTKCRWSWDVLLHLAAPTMKSSLWSSCMSASIREKERTVVLSSINDHSITYLVWNWQWHSIEVASWQSLFAFAFFNDFGCEINHISACINAKDFLHVSIQFPDSPTTAIKSNQKALAVQRTYQTADPTPDPKSKWLYGLKSGSLRLISFKTLLVQA